MYLCFGVWLQILVKRVVKGNVRERVRGETEVIGVGLLVAKRGILRKKGGGNDEVEDVEGEGRISTVK